MRYTPPCCVLHPRLLSVTPRLLSVTPAPAVCYTPGITPTPCGGRVLHSGITPALHLHYTCTTPTVTPALGRQVLHPSRVTPAITPDMGVTVGVTITPAITPVS